jgi:hypothetical protein
MPIGSLPRRADARPQDWPALGSALLRPSATSRVCLTCRWFLHHAEPETIPVLACGLHRGAIPHGDHLSRCCAAWSDDSIRQPIPWSTAALA